MTWEVGDEEEDVRGGEAGVSVVGDVRGEETL